MVQESRTGADVIVRFAPSPTGIPHVGNIRTALFNYFFARSARGKFILRIEDTDQARKVEGAIEAVENSLSWLGISWDEKIIQSSNLEEYKKRAEELVEKGFARDDNGAIRFMVPDEGSIQWTDAVGNKNVEFKLSEVEDFIILKSDGYPTYHLANVVDDHEEKITHVIRGEDWIPSTPKHILLYRAFGWEQSIPTFVHVPNIHGTDGKKLSKRRGAKSVLDFKSEGILPEALLNYLILLGWNPKDNREILTRAEIEKEFKLENINAAPAIFDEKKLSWMNSEYIRALSPDELKDRIIEFYRDASNLSNLEAFVALAQTRMKSLADFKTLVEKNKDSFEDAGLKQLAERLKNEYSALTEWKPELISAKTFQVRDEMGVSTKDIFKVLSGKTQGLPFDQVASIEGKDATIKWLESYNK